MSKHLQRRGDGRVLFSMFAVISASRQGDSRIE